MIDSGVGGAPGRLATSCANVARADSLLGGFGFIAGLRVAMAIAGGVFFAAAVITLLAVDRRTPTGSR